jgi:hypothetical protein
MNDQDHSLSLSDPDRSLVLSHLLVNFLKNLVSCQTSLREFQKRNRKTGGSRVPPGGQKFSGLVAGSER